MELCAKLRKIDFGQITITICIVILATWCSYNVSHIWQKYWKFETIISLHNDPPNRTEFPGITICAPSIFTTDKLGELFPDFRDQIRNITDGMSPERWAAQMGLSLDDNEYWQIIRTRHELFEKYESMALRRFSAVDVITKYSVRLEEIVDECHFKAYNIRNFQIDNNDLYYYDCHEIKPVLESVYENKKCFTYFSAINLKNKDSPTKYGMNGTDPEDYGDNGDYAAADTTSDKQSNETHARNSMSQPKTQAEKASEKTAARFKDGTRLKDGTPILTAKRAMSNQPFTDFCSGGVCQIYSNFSDYFEAAAREMIFDMNPSIELRVKSLDSTVWSMFTGDNSIVMTVHPPNILQNRRDFLFFQVTKSNNYEISFTKKTTILKEPPYKTACAVYDDPERKQKFSGDEIATRDECITMCIKQLSFNRTTCIQYFSVLIQRMFRREERDLESKICDHQNQNYTMFIESRKKCENLCHAECRKSIFEITGRVLTQLDTRCNSDSLQNKHSYEEEGSDNEDINAPTEDPNHSEEEVVLAAPNAAVTSGFYSGKQFSTQASQPAKRETVQPPRPQSVGMMEKSPRPKKRPQRERAESLKRIYERYKDRKLEHFGTLPSHWRPKPSSAGLDVHEYKAMHHPEHHNRQKRSATRSYTDSKVANCNARVSIRISPKPFTTVEHQAAVSFEGFLGTIGGHIGIWLGLSLYKIIKFLVHIIYSMIHNFFDLCR